MESAKQKNHPLQLAILTANGNCQTTEARFGFPWTLSAIRELFKQKAASPRCFGAKKKRKRLQTSSTYSIPAGFIYCDATIENGSKPGVIGMKDGVLRVEKTMGLLGAASKMIPCGGFEAKQVHD